MPIKFCKQLSLTKKSNTNIFVIKEIKQWNMYNCYE